MGVNVPEFEAPPSQEYKVKEGNKLDLIGKKFGFKDHRLIWEAKENAKLKQKRKQPDLIQKGDVVVIPPTPQELSKATVEHAKKLAEFLGWIRAKIDANERAIKISIQDKKETRKYYASVRNGITGVYEEAEHVANGVDAVADLAMALKNVYSLAKKGKTAVKKAGEELKAINKSLGWDVTKFVGGGAITGLEKLFEQFDEYEENPLWAWDKITSPSFYGWAVVQLYEGKSYTDAVTTNLKTDRREKLYQLELEELRKLQWIDANISRYERVIQLLKAGEYEVALEVGKNKRR